MFDLADGGRPPDDVWDASELAALLAHQLAARVQADTSIASPELARRFAACAAAQAGGAAAASPSYASLLFESAEPPLELLSIVKEIAKLQRGHESAAVRRVAGVVYYSAILVARLRHGQRISELDDVRLLQGIEQTLAHPWLEPRVRRLFDEARRRLLPPAT